MVVHVYIGRVLQILKRRARGRTFWIPGDKTRGESAEPILPQAIPLQNDDTPLLFGWTSTGSIWTFTPGSPVVFRAKK